MTTLSPRLRPLDTPDLTFLTGAASPTVDALLARVSVVIPALNEAPNLPLVLRRIPRGVHEVILVDGHSTDETIAITQACWPGIRVIVQSGRGKGDALRCGFAAATGEFIVMLDADGSSAPEEIPLYVLPLQLGYDLVKGSRFLRGGGSDDLTLVRRLGHAVLLTLTNLLHRTHYSDLCYGYCALRRRCVAALQLDASGFEIETQLNIRASRMGLRIAEVPSWERARRFGRSRLRTVRDGGRVLWVIVRELFGPHPKWVVLAEGISSGPIVPVERVF